MEETMTMGVPTTVNSNSVQRLGVSSQEPVANLGNFETNGDSVIARSETTRQSIEIETVEDTSADRILHSAKDEGFDEALIHLADGDFDEESLTQEEIPDPEVSGENNTELTPEEMEKQALMSRVQELEEQVEDLKQKNQELFNEVSKIKENAEVSNQALLMLALALYELAKKEENEEKKISLMELIISMMTLFMKEMFVPEDESGKVSNISKIQEHQTQKKNTKTPTFEQLMTILKTKTEIPAQKAA